MTGLHAAGVFGHVCWLLAVSCNVDMVRWQRLLSPLMLHETGVCCCCEITQGQPACCIERGVVIVLLACCCCKPAYAASHVWLHASLSVAELLNVFSGKHEAVACTVLCQ